MLHLYKINAPHSRDSSVTMPNNCTLGRALTLGNFDGIHLGHQAMLKRLRTQAQRLELRTTLMILEPQPQEYFCQRIHIHRSPPVRILPLYDKLRRLLHMDIDEVAILHFCSKTAALPASDFLEQWVLTRLNVRYLLTGNDFRFGKARSGDADFLQRAAQQHGFIYETIEDVSDTQCQRYSSSAIREALTQDRFTAAAHALGEHYQISGRVHRGQGLASQWNVPTANLHFRQRLPVSGIFAGFAQLLPPYNLSIPQDSKTPPWNTDRWPSVIYVGNRSSTEVDGREKLEVHLLNWSGKAFYGARLKVQFIQKIRDNKHFDDLDQLRERIEVDLVEAKKICMEQTV